VPLNNSTSWTLISGIYVAAGGENYITIGSFRDDASTNTSPGPGTWPGGSYYYIEDLGVEVATPVEQACCLPDGTCSIQFPGECLLLGGSPAGPGTTCLPSPCEGLRSARGPGAS